ncbi:MAG: ribokinase [Tagaea sp.]|nr:ribokinase [Tagaea sp.]
MIVVFGSINVDFVTRVARLPGEGETVAGGDYSVLPGGKGANQALAARRAGAEVALAGAVGEDAFAALALAGLDAAGVDLSGVRRVAAPTGAAFVAVDDAGRNQIVVASGANAHARAGGIEFPPRRPGILLVQRETTETEILAALRLARAQGWRTVVNAAPSAGFPAAMLALADYLIANEHEIADVPDRRDGATRVVVTLGAQGARLTDGGRIVRAPAPNVRVVDTTGAGDAFCGAFAAALDRGGAPEAALAFACAAGSLACETPGAQAGLPLRAAIEAIL